MMASPALAAGEAATPSRVNWSFAGPFGTFDQGQLQRGFKVYREACSACHGLSLVRFRNLSEPGGPEFSRAQVVELAAQYQIKDGPNEQGEMFERPGRPADAFPSPFANRQAAQAANGGAYPPDMSLLAKARTYERGFPWFVFDVFTQYQAQGPDYIHSLLLGYTEPPPGFTVEPGLNYNKYFPGQKIAMAQPIMDNQVEYTDGTPMTIDQYGKDVAAFLMWTAEPKMEERKRMGFRVMAFLILFAGLLYYTKKKIWADVDGHDAGHGGGKPSHGHAH
jgi:ubiquinol-cytochrome c reductase cytochrome b/c1 subunit